MQFYRTILLAFFVCVCFLSQAQKKPFIISYVTAGSKALPDPNLITHINYAFGQVNKTFNGIVISNEPRLREVVAMKKKSPHLKVLLSIGGWGSGRFSEMAATAENRSVFANDCQRIVKTFDLDGIDLDWEYPSSSESGISSSPDDIDNFTLLMQNIRKAIGRKKLLTLATIADGKYIDFKGIDPYIDFVNVMMYDVTLPPFLHNSLYRSERSGRVTLVEAMEAHMNAGVKKEKLVMGIPFYGRGNKKQTADYVMFKDYAKLSGFEEKWDDVAKVPYLQDEKGTLIFTFENVESLKLKAAYIKAQGLLGAMYWEFSGDDDQLSMSKALYESLN